MKPLDPAEYALCIRATEPLTTIQMDLPELARIRSSGLFRYEIWADGDSSWVLSEAGERALRIHRLFLASGGGQ